MENCIICQNCGDTIHRPSDAKGPRPKYCSKILCNAQHRGKVVSVLSIMTHSWSSHGGGNPSSAKKVDYDWFCQACGEQFPEQMSPLKFPIDIFGKEYANVCGNCFATGVNHQLKVFDNLAFFVRRRLHGIW